MDFQSIGPLGRCPYSSFYIIYSSYFNIYSVYFFNVLWTGKLVDLASRCIFLWCVYAWFMMCLMCDMHCNVFYVWFVLCDACDTRCVESCVQKTTRFFNLPPYEWCICFVCCVMCEGFVCCVLDVKYLCCMFCLVCSDMCDKGDCSIQPCP